MKIHDTPAEEEVPLWRRAPVGVGVVALLLLLLHGPRGAVLALAHQAWAVVATLLGGDQVVAAVLSQTAPLALATAVIVVCYRIEWITFESTWSVIACSAILLGGASVGAELRGFMQGVLPPLDVALQQEERGPESGVTLAWLKHRVNPQTNTLSAADAMRALSDREYVTGLGADEHWPDQVPRVALLPEKGSWLSVVGRGGNQLLGYLVFYRPRLFLAALIAGGYLGWALHRRWCWAEDKVEQLRSDFDLRRAA